MKFEQIDSAPMKARLTRRYVFALSLIACVLAASFGMVMFQISLSEKDAYLVNISGMQRMLSQRVALMSREVHDASRDEDAQIYFDKMEDATQRMVQNHHQLTSGDLSQNGHYTLSDNIRDMYFGENGLDARVVAYTDLSNQFLRTYRKRDFDQVEANALVEQIVFIARNGLLDALDEAVHRYEYEAEQRIQKFHHIEALVLCVGFLTLLAEVLFIFKPMAESVERGVRALEASNGELLEFSYRISHDLRAPIVSSLGLVGVASDAVEAGNKDVAAASLVHIKKSMVTLEQLISDVLNLTKMKMTDVPKEEINLHKVVDGIISGVLNLPGAEGIDIQMHIDGDGVIFTKKMYVHQVLENLISNAVKYYDPSEAQPFVRVGVQVNKDVCKICVADNGLGVPEAYHKDMFKMFARFHPKVSFGSGLGLYLVSQNVAVLNGDIHYNATDDGSEFVVNFPCA